MAKASLSFIPRPWRSHFVLPQIHGLQVSPVQCGRGLHRAVAIRQRPSWKPHPFIHTVSFPPQGSTRRQAFLSSLDRCRNEFGEAPASGPTGPQARPHSLLPIQTRCVPAGQLGLREESRARPPNYLLAQHFLIY